MSDDLIAAIHARPKRRQGITGQTIDAQMRGTMCQITEWELEELCDELSRLRAEVERLKWERDVWREKVDHALQCERDSRAALADERRHADALAEALANVEYMSRSHASDDLLVQHRARRQG